MLPGFCVQSPGERKFDLLRDPVQRLRGQLTTLGRAARMRNLAARREAFRHGGGIDWYITRLCGAPSPPNSDRTVLAFRAAASGRRARSRQPVSPMKTCAFGAELAEKTWSTCGGDALLLTASGVRHCGASASTTGIFPGASPYTGSRPSLVQTFPRPTRLLSLSGREWQWMLARSPPTRIFPDGPPRGQGYSGASSPTWRSGSCWTILLRRLPTTSLARRSGSTQHHRTT